MTSLFHSTSEAAARLIDAQGFRDSNFLDIASGVFLADRPVDAGDGVAAATQAVFVVYVPKDFALADFEVLEEGRPADAYREWLIPSSIVNKWVRERYQDDGVWRGTASVGSK